MNSSAYVDLFTHFEEQEWILPHYQIVSRVLAAVGTICFIFLSYLILKKTRTLNREFARALFYSLLSPTLMSCYVGILFLPNIILPYDVVVVHGLLRSSWVPYKGFREFNHIGLNAFSFFCVPYVASLIYLSIIYLKAFFKTTHFHVDKWIQVVIGALAVSVVTGGCLLSYSSFGYKQEWKRDIVIAGNPLNKIIFDEYGGFVANMIEAPVTMIATVAITAVEIVTSWLIGLLLIFKFYQTMQSRKLVLSKTTYGLQRMLICVFVLHIILFISMYGFPATFCFVVVYFKVTQLSRYPVGVVCALSLCAMPTVYCLGYLSFVSPIRRAFLYSLYEGRRPRKKRQLVHRSRFQLRPIYSQVFDHFIGLFRQ